MLVLQGQDALNSLALRSAASPVVQVFDRLGGPLEGADVTFEVPTDGPGGLFDNHQSSFKTRTDARGQAAANFMPNTLPGKFTIRVIAIAGDERAEVVIRQTNSAKAAGVEYKPQSRPWYKDWKWWAVIAAGAGTAGYFGYHAASSTSAPTISLTTGTITIGGPH